MFPTYRHTPVLSAAKTNMTSNSLPKTLKSGKVAKSEGSLVMVPATMVVFELERWVGYVYEGCCIDCVELSGDADKSGSRVEGGMYDLIWMSSEMTYVDYVPNTPRKDQFSVKLVMRNMAGLTINWLNPNNKNPAPTLLLVNLKILATLLNT